MNESLSYAIEVKDGSKCPSARRLTADEQKFIATWSGQVCIVASVEDARAIVDQARQITLEFLGIVE
jgi:hypothetical protein